MYISSNFGSKIKLFLKNLILGQKLTFRIVCFNVMIHTQLTVSVAMQTNFRFAPDRKIEKTQFLEFDELFANFYYFISGSYS